MHAHAVFPLLCCFLFPREIRTAPTAAAHSPALRDALERARMLADKISKDVPAAYAEGSTLDLPQQTGDLQMMAVALRIPPAPVLKPLSQHFDMDTCVSRMAEGVRMFQGLLGVLSTRLGGLDGLRADLRDLLTQIAKVTVTLSGGAHSYVLMISAFAGAGSGPAGRRRDGPGPGPGAGPVGGDGGGSPRRLRGAGGRSTDAHAAQILRARRHPKPPRDRRPQDARALVGATPTLAGVRLPRADVLTVPRSVPEHSVPESRDVPIACCAALCRTNTQQAERRTKPVAAVGGAGSQPC
ncbi:uncharacterized protein LOC133466477 isoform X1 [Phyllopteryx taeniolatus]|uniref:uncharacterized protein LOC133466477 isoform X1 n=1 Tax=Phyllopteryx taeniolatus TaxID=161469 RepID=UPI002AD489C8|nr:uncharacterized protein LOC133466477 isoform X1 [Phyllopteryx taeniolatus]